MRLDSKLLLAFFSEKNLKVSLSKDFQNVTFSQEIY